MIPVGWLALLGLLVLLACLPLLAGQSSPGGAALMDSAYATVAGETQGQELRLPFAWDKFRPGVSGRVVLEMGFDALPPSPNGYALVVYRMGNGYSVSVNGAQQDAFGDLERHFSTDSKLPRLIPITAPLASRNQLRVELRTDTGRQAALSGLAILPMEQARELFDSYWRNSVLVRQGVMVFSAIVALIGLGLWLTQASLDEAGTFRRERLYLYGGVAEMAWVFRLADGLVENPPLPLPVWSVLASLSLGVWGSLTLLFCMEVIGWGKSRWMAPVQTTLKIVLALGLAGAAAAWGFQQAWALTAWYLLLGLGFLVFGVLYLRGAASPAGNWQSRLMAVAIVINVLAGLADLYRQRIAPNAAAFGFLYMASVLFGFAAGVTVLMRFRQVSQQAQQLTRHLVSMVETKESQLRQSFLRMAELSREQAREQERARVLRDLHDGVGAHLSVAMRQLEAGQVSRERVLATLRESMDQLKLSIDAIHLPPGDVTMVLANVRYRFEQRLREAGIALHWNVQAIEPLARLGDKEMRDLQFIVYGVLSNVLQHAGATELDVSAVEEAGVVRVSLTDNGRGFDAQAPLRAGLTSLTERAIALGGGLQVESQKGRTCLVLRLPRVL